MTPSDSPTLGLTLAKDIVEAPYASPTQPVELLLTESQVLNLILFYNSESDWTIQSIHKVDVNPGVFDLSGVN